MYNYRKSKETVEAILKSPTKIVEMDNIPASVLHSLMKMELKHGLVLYL